MKRTALAVSFALILAPSLHAATYVIDPAHTTVSFKIRHFASKVQGLFKDVSGTIEYDPQHPEKASVVATIKADSIDTHVPDRDKHLRSPDFFDVEKYPEIRFVSSSVTKTGANKFKVDGTLDMHGTKKTATLDVEFGGEDETGKGAKAGFSAMTTLKRTEFNIVWNKTLDSGKLILGDDVAISLEIEANKGASKAAGGKGAAKTAK